MKRIGWHALTRGESQGQEEKGHQNEYSFNKIFVQYITDIENSIMYWKVSCIENIEYIQYHVLKGISTKNTKEPNTARQKRCVYLKYIYMGNSKGNQRQQKLHSKGT